MMNLFLWKWLAMDLILIQFVSSAFFFFSEMFVFGGCSKDYAAMEDLWKLNLGKKKAQWTRVEPIGFPPPARWLHTADVIQSDVRIDLGLGWLCWLCWLCWKQSNVLQRH